MKKSRYHYTNLVIFCFFLASSKSPIENHFLYFGKTKTLFLCHMVFKIFKHMFSDFFKPNSLNSEDPGVLELIV